MPPPLTQDAAADVLLALALSHRQNGRSPSIRELAGDMGIPRTTLHHRLTVLEDQGLLRWEHGMPRTLVLTQTGKWLLTTAKRAWAAPE